MSKIISNILQRSGTGQEQRYIQALNPDNFELHDFTTEDWILFAYNFAEYLNYYSVKNNELPSGDWTSFFNKLIEKENPHKRGSRNYKKLKKSIEEVLNQYKNESKLTPHLTLFICFLQLLEFSKKRFNQLTKRHLDFYYKEVLQVTKNKPVPDQTHVLFELAKKLTNQKVDAETALDAKKDALGNQLVYKTNDELIVNKASVGALKTIYNANTNQLQKIKASTVANTFDGIEEPLLEEEPYWYPFGYPEAVPNKAKELPDAALGFSIASPMLRLKEGERTVTITITFTKNFTDKKLIDVEKLRNSIQVFGSGEEAWIITKLLEINKKSKGKIALTKSMEFTFTLGIDTPPLVDYNEVVLLKKYHTKYPVVRFIFDLSEEIGYNFYRVLAGNTVAEIKVKSVVKGVQSLFIENDNGQLKTTKPFHPFTTRPIKGSNFKINYSEAFAKKWTKFTVNMLWKNTPDDFKSWYGAYVKQSSFSSITTYAKELSEELKDRDLIVSGYEHFQVEENMLHANGTSVANTKAGAGLLFSKKENVYNYEITFDNKNKFPIDKAGPLQLSLEQSFLHESYPRYYALAVSSEDKTINLPNEPYTPLVETITADYEAEEMLIMKNAQLEGNRIQLFHEHPFGQHEENYAFKKVQHSEKNIREIFDKENVETLLVPRYCLGGHLFIGLKDVQVQQNVSLLIQVLEGSENPLTPSFQGNEKVDWSILCSNKWKSLEEETIVNNTCNFLQSGIVKFNIPKEATATNTLLPEGYVWLRARMNKSFDAVCKVINIHTQAVVATFENNNNEVSHLKDGLPSGTIKKMITRIPQVKSITQPYNAFGGSPEESDANFYRRISERLRHKNRAITMWDYEHIILQKFPEIYKVKCLNHTSEKSFTAAGDVTLIVVPDTVNKNVFDIYQPRVSTATLLNIKEHVNALNTMHVTAEVINPNYQEVTIALEAKFYEGYDRSFYTKQLENDITKFLSPWAFDDTKEVTFGVLLHKSVLIDYIEKLPYVDYLQHVKMNGDATINKVVPEDPKSILVSAKKHTIKPLSFTCGKPIIKTEQECQL